LITLTGLHYYPIKSCAGTTVSRAQTTERGLIDDRNYMVIDADNQFLTQREYARMALIKPTIRDGILTVNAPNMQPLTVDPMEYSETREVVIWKDTCRAHDMGNLAAEWFSTFLGTTARLVHQDHSRKRRVDPTYAQYDSAEASFSDGFPFLLISEASLVDLNSRLATPLLMNRFRPNLVVAGCEPFAEDTWKRICVGTLELALVKPCARCVITTTDQATAERGKEPLATMASFRRTQGNAKVMFGQNVIYAQPEPSHGDWLEVGTPIEVLELR
jgi:uncharacterized protein YcbX